MKGLNKFKKGDRVYYHADNNKYFGGSATIPCEVTKVNSKTLTLSDGESEYRNVKPSSVYHQCTDYPSHINS